MNAVVNKNSFFFYLFAALFLSAAVMSVQSGNYLFAILPFIAFFIYYSWHEPRQLFIILLISLPFSFEYNFTPSLGTDLPDEPLMLIVSGIFFMRLIFLQKLLTRHLFSHPLILILLFWICWMLFSAILSTNPLLSLKYVVAKAWYIGAFVVPAILLFRERKNLNIAIRVILISMGIVTLVILFKHSRFGFRFASVNDAVAPFFRNHVNYSAMLVCLIPVCFGVYMTTKNLFEKRWVIIVGTVFLVALYFSYSRGGWLALLAGFLAWWLIKMRILFKSFLISSVIVIVAVFWLSTHDRYLDYAPDYKTTIFHENFSSHLVSTYKLKDLSTAERFYRWVAGVRMIKDYALHGSGPNSFYPLYKEYTVPAYKTWVSDNAERSGVHNYFLLTAVEQGLPGLLFLLILIGAIIYYSEKSYHLYLDSTDKYIYVVIGIVITMIILLNFLSDLIETDKIGSLFFLCIGTLVATDLRHSKKSKSSANIQRIS